MRYKNGRLSTALGQYETALKIVFSTTRQRDSHLTIHGS